MLLDYPILMQRCCPFLCDQAILLLSRDDAYFCAIRLSYCYVKVLPTSKRLGYPIVIIEELPISVQLGYPIVLGETAYFYAIGYSTVV